MQDQKTTDVIGREFDVKENTGLETDGPACRKRTDRTISTFTSCQYCVFIHFLCIMAYAIHFAVSDILTV